jgi:hypothetical protein
MNTVIVGVSSVYKKLVCATQGKSQTENKLVFFQREGIVDFLFLFLDLGT